MSNKLTVINKAYLAGLLDGEGCISITIRSPRNREISSQVVSQFTIQMTQKDLVEWVKDTTGVGSISHAPARTAKHKDTWRWGVSIKPAVALLSQLLPYLRVKRRQAELLIELSNLKDHSFSYSGMSYQHNVQRQFEIAKECMKLNRRGPDTE